MRWIIPNDVNFFFKSDNPIFPKYVAFQWYKNAIDKDTEIDIYVKEKGRIIRNCKHVIYCNISQGKGDYI